MLRRALIPVTLVTLVSIAGFWLGQKFRHGDAPVLLLAMLTMLVVLLASAIMRQTE